MHLDVCNLNHEDDHFCFIRIVFRKTESTQLNYESAWDQQNQHSQNIDRLETYLVFLIEKVLNSKQWSPSYRTASSDGLAFVQSSYTYDFVERSHTTKALFSFTYTGHTSIGHTSDEAVIVSLRRLQSRTYDQEVHTRSAMTYKHENSLIWSDSDVLRSKKCVEWLRDLNKRAQLYAFVYINHSLSVVKNQGLLHANLIQHRICQLLQEHPIHEPEQFMTLTNEIILSIDEHILDFLDCLSYFILNESTMIDDVLEDRVYASCSLKGSGSEIK
jgi:hypothetical protein